MRRDEYLSRQKKEETEKIPKDVLNTVANQWLEAGFTPNELLDEKGNWYMEAAPSKMDVVSINRTFSRMCDFWRNELNWGINAQTGKHYTKEDAQELAQEYLYRFVEQDFFPKKNRISFPNSGGISIRDAIVIDGWQKTTMARNKRLFAEALAATILGNVKCYREQSLGTEWGTYNEWFQWRVSWAKRHTPNLIAPSPHFYYNGKDYAIERISPRDSKKPHYICHCDMPRWFFVRWKAKNLFSSDAFISILSLLAIALFAIVVIATW